jgi:MFS family permease
MDSSIQEHALLEEKQRSAPVSTQTRGLGRTFLALRHRNYRLYFFGQMISQVGTWMQTTAQAWLVLQLTHSALLLGVVSLLQYLPVMMFSLYGGVLADRVPKRRLLLVTQSISLVQSAIMWLLVITGVVQVWHVLLLVALLGTTNVLDSPTRNAFINEMVGREDLPNAIALNSSLASMARVLGPGLGGVLIAWLGVAPLFLLNMLSFIAVIIGLFLIDTRTLYSLPGKRTDEKKSRPLQSVREGLSYSWHMPAVLLIICLIGGVGMFGMTLNVMLPLFATEVFHAGATGYGFIAAAYGLGALFSALWVAWGNRQPSIRFLLIAVFTFSTLEIAFALSPVYILAFPLLIGIGFAQLVVIATASTAVQTIVPNHLRGRVIGVFLLVYTGALPLGNFLAGALTTRLGVSTTFLLGGTLCHIVTITAWLLRQPAEKSLEESIIATEGEELTEKQARIVLQEKRKNDV